LEGKEFSTGDEDFGGIAVHSYGHMEDIIWETSGFIGEIERT
jgi:hypothetical protein